MSSRSKRTERGTLFWSVSTVVACVAMLVSVNAIAETMVWQVDFESELGVAVTHGQGFLETGYSQDGITDIDPEPSVDAAQGGLRNSGGSTVSWYAQYANAGVPDMPAALDPTGAAGSFAARMGVSNWRMAAKDINSNCENCNETLTMEGYFNNQEDLVTELVGQYDLLKRTFVQQKRSTTSYHQSRLWIGMGVKSGVGEEEDIPVLALQYATTADPDILFIAALGDTEIVQGVWHHFALVLNTYDDEGTETSDLTAYLDGEVEISVVGLTNLHPAGAKEFCLAEASQQTPAQSFIGYLDTVRITDAALSPSKFLIVPEPGLVVCLIGLLPMIWIRRRRAGSRKRHSSVCL